VTAPWHSFLFADLVGFTALAELEGDDRALEVALGLQRRVRLLLEDHEAEQVKAIGDGLMLRSTKASEAVTLGLRVVEAAEEPGSPPVRVGIHTGPAVTNQGDWYGRAVNVAARLCSVAPPGQVLISEATRAAAGRMFGVNYGGRELHWLRNVSEPIGAYLVQAPGAPSRKRAALGSALGLTVRASEAIA
jgi:adenylate cyclase